MIIEEMDIQTKPMINWFPGHMAKTRRLLQDHLRRVDLVIELCDARLPYSSRNPELEKMIAGKRHVLFQNNHMTKYKVEVELICVREKRR